MNKKKRRAIEKAKKKQVDEGGLVNTLKSEYRSKPDFYNHQIKYGAGILVGTGAVHGAKKLYDRHQAKKAAEQKTSNNKDDSVDEFGLLDFYDESSLKESYIDDDQSQEYGIYEASMFD